MANVIKIKRSSATAAPTTLNEGELAVSFLSGKLFVGNSTAVIPIGGVHSPGVLTANQALVANATSAIDKIIVANLQPTFIYANGASGTDGQVLISNSTGGVFWGAATSDLNSLSDVTITSIANNQLLIYDNSSAQFENHSLSGTASQVNVAFSSQDITISLPTDVIVNTSLSVGNSTVNSVVNSTALATNSAAIAGQITVGSNVTVNTSTIFIGNSTVNTTIQAGNIALRGTQLLVGNTLFDGDSISVGNSTVNTSINSTSVSVDGEVTSGNTNITGFINVSSTANVGGAITARADVTVNGTLTVANTASLGNTTVNVLLTVGNSTVNSTINSTSASLGNTTITGFANVTGTAQVSTSVSVGSNVVLATGTLSIGNSTVNTVINSTSVSTSGLTVANLTVSGDLEVQGNTKLGNATSDIISINGKVNTHIIPSSNLTFSLGNNTLYWAEVHAGNVHADFGYFNQDVAIYGDLTVSGNLVTTNVQSVVISDPMIYLAGNNTSSDLVDIGFVGNYFQSATSKHAGLIRDASVDQFFLFRGLTQDLEAQLTVNTADATFTIADLNAFLISGALVSNSTTVTITANATVNVNITANTLSLSTALAVGSGGTGLTTVTAKGILYGNSTGPLGITSAGTDGQVLQANSTGFPVFADLDGGSF